MSFSENFTDEDLISQLKLQFEYDEMHDLNWSSIFSHIQDTGKTYQLRFRGRVFQIDKITGSVSEVNKV